jgi:hypothetical protein
MQRQAEDEDQRTELDDQRDDLGHLRFLQCRAVRVDEFPIDVARP